MRILSLTLTPMLYELVKTSHNFSFFIIVHERGVGLGFEITLATALHEPYTSTVFLYLSVLSHGCV